MKVLVIGGTRFIGPPTVRRLLQAGYDVTLFHRGQTPSGIAGTKEVLGDRRPLAPHVDLLREEKPDVVLDMIALTERDGRELMDAFLGVARRVVMVSSMDVYLAFARLRGTEPGDPVDYPITEESRLREKLFPYRTETPRADDDPRKVLDDYDKIPIEKIVLGESALPGTVLRLPMVYGPGDYQHRLYEYAKRMADGRPVILLQDSLASWRTARGYVHDIAEAICNAVTDDRAAGQVFNVAESVFHEEREWVGLIGRALEWTGEVVELPSSEMPETMRTEFDGRQHLIVDSSKIRRMLGWEARTDPVEAIRATVEYELANPPERFEADYLVEDAAANSVRMAP